MNIDIVNPKREMLLKRHANGRKRQQLSEREESSEQSLNNTHQTTYVESELVHEIERNLCNVELIDNS